jgi:hypothetical protein
LLYPDDDIVTVRYSRILLDLAHSDACDPDKVREYTDEFIDWARTRLGIEVQRTGHPEILMCRCLR